MDREREEVGVKRGPVICFDPGAAWQLNPAMLIEIIRMAQKTCMPIISLCVP